MNTVAVKEHYQMSKHLTTVWNEIPFLKETDFSRSSTQLQLPLRVVQDAAENMGEARARLLFTNPANITRNLSVSMIAAGLSSYPPKAVCSFRWSLALLLHC